MEIAYERTVLVVGLPAPLDDGQRGGTPALDLYLVPGVSEVRTEVDRADLARASDAASAFCVTGDGELALDRAATLCIVEAALLAVDASETPFARRAIATDLWLSVGSPTSLDALTVDDAQGAPWRAVAARDRSPLTGGGALLADYLDVSRGRGAPGAVGLATYALSAGPRSPVAARYTNEPDTLDVLRATFGPTPTDVARFFGDFAVARAFMGSRDAEGRWPTLAWTADLGRVRFEWSVPFSSLPRTLAPAHPVEPTGSTYLWVSFDGPSEGKSLILQADWEPPVAFRWAALAVAADGRVVRKFDVPFLERGTHVERVVSDLSGAAGVLIAGTNLGGLGPTYPFDPDFEPDEPHGYTVYLAAQ